MIPAARLLAAAGLVLGAAAIPAGLAVADPGDGVPWVAFNDHGDGTGTVTASCNSPYTSTRYVSGYATDGDGAMAGPWTDDTLATDGMGVISFALPVETRPGYSGQVAASIYCSSPELGGRGADHVWDVGGPVLAETTVTLSVVEVAPGSFGDWAAESWGVVPGFGDLLAGAPVVSTRTEGETIVIDYRAINPAIYGVSCSNGAVGSDGVLSFVVSSEPVTCDVAVGQRPTIALAASGAPGNYTWSAPTGETITITSTDNGFGWGETIEPWLSAVEPGTYDVALLTGPPGVDRGIGCGHYSPASGTVHFEPASAFAFTVGWGDNVICAAIFAAELVLPTVPDQVVTVEHPGDTSRFVELVPPEPIGGVPAIDVTCDAVSGDFALGEHLVTCTATDARGRDDVPTVRTASTSYRVTVIPQAVREETTTTTTTTTQPEPESTTTTTIPLPDQPSTTTPLVLDTTTVPDPTPDLPTTGSSTTTTALLGAALIAAGVPLAAVARRRRA